MSRSPQRWIIRPALLAESDVLAALFRASREAALPYLPDLHTPSEDRAFVRDRVFAECEVWVADRDGDILAFCAFRPGWVEHLYVERDHWGAGIGSALLAKAMASNDALQLWTFQRNERARGFYERHGFRCVRTTEGDNEEREPDALYAWARSAPGR